MKRAGILLIVLVAAAGALAYTFRLTLRERVAHVVSGVTNVVSGVAHVVSGFSRTGGATDAAPPIRLKPDTTSSDIPRAEVSIDPRRQQLIGVRTVPARRTSLAPTIRTTGSVRADETRQTDVNLKLEGWIRDLYVDYTGQAVRREQPLFTLYSPELFTTEQEYVLALKSREQMQSSQIAEARERADQLVASARQRLTLWDLTAEQIRDLDEKRQPHDVVVFRSPVDGVVMDKQAVKGAHVMPGQTLYKIADLSVVWVEADVY